MDALSGSKLWLARRPVLRTTILLLIHLGAWTAAFNGAVWLATGDRSCPQASLVGAGVWLLFLATKGAGARLSGSFRERWRTASIEDLRAMLKTSLTTSAVLFMALLCVPGRPLPPWVALLDGVLTLVGLGSVRVLFHLTLGPRTLVQSGSPVILAGREAFVEIELRRMRVRPGGGSIVGLYLEDLPSEGVLLRRVPVLSKAGLERLLDEGTSASVVFVQPIGAGFLAELATLCRAAGVSCQPVSSPDMLTDLVETAAAELLDRKPVHVDVDAMARAIGGKRVLVTGGGGSIGSELARQVLRMQPAELVVVERAENALFRVEQSLAAQGSAVRVVPVLLDVRNRAAVAQCFAQHRPELVLHAAAHKHVPMMERHPVEAFLNNVIGTRIVADAADACGTKTFVFVSTDKAVRPSSVMGTTKRIGEMYVRSLDKRSQTRFAAVRFGNVLGSSGSVVPIFIDQIKRGRPLTVTHPEMSRYFMSIPEASQLVLEAAALAEGGETFVLDMGTPMKIVDLARRLIERAGLRPGDDVPIIFSGARPGEKLNEELFYTEESANKTRVPGIWVAPDAQVPRADLAERLDEIERYALAGEDDAVLRLMSELVPEYVPQGRGPLQPETQRRPARARTEVAEALRASDRDPTPWTRPVADGAPGREAEH